MCVPHVVGTVGAHGEAHGVAGIELVLAFGRANRGPTLEDDQPLLIGPFEMVWADRLARRQIVDTHAQPRRAELRPNAGGPARITRRLKRPSSVSPLKRLNVSIVNANS